MAVAHQIDLGPATAYRTGYVGFDLTLKVALAIHHLQEPYRRELVNSWNRLTDEQHAGAINCMRESVRFILSDESPHELSKAERAELKFWLSLGELATLRRQDCPDWAKPRLPMRHDGDDELALQ